MKTLLITGPEGMIASHFTTLYGDKFNLRFLSRRPEGDNAYYWDPATSTIDVEAVIGVDAVLHLAGAPISKHKWSATYRDEILTSRAYATALIGYALGATNTRLETFISASAVGFYGHENRGEVLRESASAGVDYLAEVCRAWEEEAALLHAENLAERFVVARFGTVLCHYAGALSRMAIGSEFGIAPVLGSGDQPFAWIHINDLCRMLRFMIDNPKVRGVYNAVAPQHITYRDIAHTLAETRGGRANELWLPRGLVRFLLRDCTDLILDGNHISSSRIEEAGYDFLYPTIAEAIKYLYAK